MKTYNVYTDGSCRGNGKAENIGGWAFVIQDSDTKEIVAEKGEQVKNTTNNQMEMTAILEGIKYCVQNLSNEYCDFNIYTDSAYCQRGFAEKWWVKWQKNGWRTTSGTPVKNKELWESLIPYFQNPQFDFSKVAGHTGVELNERCDKLARGLV